MHAAAKGDVAMVRLLVAELGADKEAKDEVRRMWEWGCIVSAGLHKPCHCHFLVRGSCLPLTSPRRIVVVDCRAHQHAHPPRRMNKRHSCTLPLTTTRT